MTTITHSQVQGSVTAGNIHAALANVDLSGPPGRVVQVTVTAYPPSGAATALACFEDGWTRVSAPFGPAHGNLQAAVRKATTAIFEKVDPTNDETLTIASSQAAVFAHDLAIIDPE